MKEAGGGEEALSDLDGEATNKSPPSSNMHTKKNTHTHKDIYTYIQKHKHTQARTYAHTQ